MCTLKNLIHLVTGLKQQFAKHGRFCRSKLWKSTSTWYQIMLRLFQHQRIGTPSYKFGFILLLGTATYFPIYELFHCYIPKLLTLRALRRQAEPWEIPWWTITFGAHEYPSLTATAIVLDAFPSAATPVQARADCFTIILRGAKKIKCHLAPLWNILCKKWFTQIYGRKLIFEQVLAPFRIVL